MINKWIIKNRIIRRILVFAFSYCFLKVTMNLFSGKITLQPGMNVIYGAFAGLVILILKFYFQGKKDEADND